MPTSKYLFHYATGRILTLVCLGATVVTTCTLRVFFLPCHATWLAPVPLTRLAVLAPSWTSTTLPEWSPPPTRRPAPTDASATLAPSTATSTLRHSCQRPCALQLVVPKASPSLVPPAAAPVFVETQAHLPPSRWSPTRSAIPSVLARPRTNIAEDRPWSACTTRKSQLPTPVLALACNLDSWDATMKDPAESCPITRTFLTRSRTKNASCHVAIWVSNMRKS